MAIPGPVFKVESLSATAMDVLVIEGKRAIGLDNSDVVQVEHATLGDPIELEPDRLNILWLLQGEAPNFHNITETGKFERVEITPKFALL